jgi:hypothetical protein
MAAAVPPHSPLLTYCSPGRTGTPRTDEDSLSGTDDFDTLILSTENASENEIQIISKALNNNNLQKLSLEYIANLNEFFDGIALSLNENTSLQKISLEKMNLSGSNLQRLLVALISKPITKLSIQNCSLQPADIQLLAQVIPCFPHLQELELSEKILSTELPTLCTAILQCTSLNILYLRSCSIQDTYIPEFAEVLKSHPSLTCVDLSGNNILRLHACLAEALEKNPRITDFNINKTGVCPTFQTTHYADKSAMKRIVQALRKNRTQSIH